MAQRILHEAGTLTASKTASGTYPVRIITEGKGSSGTYSRALLEKPETQRAFEGALSFMGHPLDPEKPHLRPAEDIAGKLIGEVTGKVVEGKYGLYSEFEPNDTNPQRAAFIDKYAEDLGLSIYIGGDGKQVNGEYMVESFDGSDPYRSVDVVVAAGRGGRFERAMESFRAITKTSVETEQDPDATSAQAREKEQMDKEILEALNALKTSFDTFVTESKAPAKTPVAEADADATEKAVAEALTAYDEKVKAINAVEGLLPSQVASLLAEAKAGKDIAPLIESEKAKLDEFTKRQTEGAPTVAYGRYVEAAKTGKDLTVRGMFA